MVGTVPADVEGRFSYTRLLAFMWRCMVACVKSCGDQNEDNIIAKDSQAFFGLSSAPRMELYLGQCHVGSLF